MSVQVLVSGGSRQSILPPDLIDLTYHLRKGDTVQIVATFGECPDFGYT